MDTKRVFDHFQKGAPSLPLEKMGVLNRFFMQITEIDSKKFCLLHISGKRFFFQMQSKIRSVIHNAFLILV